VSAPAGAQHAPRGPAWLLVAIAVSFLVLFLLLPLVTVFATALGGGLGRYLDTIAHPDTLAAIRMTALTVLVAVPLNTLFGLAAAWAVARFEFRGKRLLVALIDLPLAVSPVVAGLVFVFLFGARGLLGPWLLAHDIKVIYAPLGIVLATAFITVPFVARELIPLLQALGDEEELAALSLGASGWQVFWRVTLPSIRWGLLYGVIVCTARALGEFGAVSVVSGHIRGETNTMPLHVEILYNEYDQAGAFAVASLLSIVGLLALIGKKLVAWPMARGEQA
jgi:sulfate transport system permease protein